MSALCQMTGLNRAGFYRSRAPRQASPVEMEIRNEYALRLADSFKCAIVRNLKMFEIEIQGWRRPRTQQPLDFRTHQFEKRSNLLLIDDGRTEVIVDLEPACIRISAHG